MHRTKQPTLSRWLSVKKTQSLGVLWNAILHCEPKKWCTLFNLPEEAPCKLTITVCRVSWHAVATYNQIKVVFGGVVLSATFLQSFIKNSQNFTMLKPKYKWCEIYWFAVYCIYWCFLSKICRLVYCSDVKTKYLLSVTMTVNGTSACMYSGVAQYFWTHVL